MIGGVAILPQESDAQSLVRFRADHSESIGGPPIGIVKHPPHVSVMQCPLRADVPYEALLIAIRDLLPPEARGLLVMTALSYQPIGWLFVNLALEPWLAMLQRTTIQKLEPFIDTTAIDRDKPLDGYTPEERLSYLRYGYRYTGVSFRPHVTLGRLAPEQAYLINTLRAELKQAVGEWSFSPRSLIFYEAGQFGVIERVISAVPW